MSRVAGREPYDLHDLLHAAHISPGLDMNHTDPARHIKTTYMYLHRDMSDEVNASIGLNCTLMRAKIIEVLIQIFV